MAIFDIRCKRKNNCKLCRKTSGTANKKTIAIGSKIISYLFVEAEKICMRKEYEPFVNLIFIIISVPLKSGH